MTRLWHLISLAGAGMLLAMASTAHAQGRVEDAPDPYVHATGVEFPADVDGFVRRQVSEFNASGTDASAGYILADNARLGMFHLYIYPKAGRSCESAYAGATVSIDRYDGAEKLDEGDNRIMAGFAGEEQFFATYSIPAGALGGEHPDLLSELWLACPSSDWFVKLRLSYPAEAGEIMAGRAEDLFAAIDWTPVLGSE